MKLIDSLSEKQNHRCCYCGHRMHAIPNQARVVPRKAATKEHVTPKSHNGLGLIENLVAACRLCNELRGNMDAIAFYNLQQKWFRRDKSLRNRWHEISTAEYQVFKLRCLQTQYNHLKGLSRHCRISRFRFVMFSYHHNERLQLRA